jgi:hypothetical protein
MNGMFFDEPELEFLGGKHIDIRFGLSTYGALDSDSESVKSKIRLGLVGDQASIDKFTAWVEKCSGGVPAKKTKLITMFPAFPGFGEGKPICEFVCSSQMSRSINKRDLVKLTTLGDREKIVSDSVDRYVLEVNDLYENTNCDIVICLVPAELLKPIDMGSEPRFGPRSRKPKESGKHKTVWHDLLKARSMNARGPVQMVRPATYGGKIHRYRQDGEPTKNVEDPASIAWNFFVGLYYKGGGIPWRLTRFASDLSTCFVGISYFHDVHDDSVQTSVAQVFNERGEGVVIRGGQAVVVKDDKTVHMDADTASELIANALALYKREHKNLPARLVCHKSSYFDDGEQKGIANATDRFGIDQLNLLSFRKSSVRLFRNKANPPLRGTSVELDATRSLLYTQGSVDFYRSYPGMYIPRPIEILFDQIDSSPEVLIPEVLALTKMNWNSTRFVNAFPITIGAAKNVGSVLRYLDSDSPLQARYSFYM